jgi:hypothetical protein
MVEDRILWRWSRPASRSPESAAVQEAACDLDPLCSNFLQCPLAQKIGIALASLGKFEDSPRDNFVGEIAPVRKPEGHANHFERNAHDARGFGVEPAVVQECRDGHEPVPLMEQSDTRGLCFVRAVADTGIRSMTKSSN